MVSPLGHRSALPPATHFSVQIWNRVRLAEGGRCPARTQNRPVKVGFERCLEHPRGVIGQARFGLLMHQASVDRRLRYACDLLAAGLPGQLGAIFTPQHGLWGEQQSNMDETPHGMHPRWQVPLYSLYSETRQPTRRMLESLRCWWSISRMWGRGSIPTSGRWFIVCRRVPS